MIFPGQSIFTNCLICQCLVLWWVVHGENEATSSNSPIHIIHLAKEPMTDLLAELLADLLTL